MIEMKKPYEVPRTVIFVVAFGGTVLQRCSLPA